jgi:hypothetical protein
MKTSKTTRRRLLLGVGAAVMTQWPSPLSAGSAALQPIVPGDAGFVPDLEARLDKAIAAGRIWNLHGLVVLRNDRLVLERIRARKSVRPVGAGSDRMGCWT